MTGHRMAQSFVFVVDDDVDLREALKALFRSVGLRVEAFELDRRFFEI